MELLGPLTMFISCAMQCNTLRFPELYKCVGPKAGNDMIDHDKMQDPTSGLC